MKRIYLMMLCSLLAYLPASFGQLSQGGEPPSFTENLPESVLQLQKIEALTDADINEWENQDIQDGREWYRVGVPRATNFTLENSGTWQTLRNGDKLWRLKVNIENTVGLSFLFDDFFLPTGAQFFIYSEDRSHILGAYTVMNNNKAHQFATEVLNSSTGILEYIEPADKIGEGHISLNTVGAIYKDCIDFEGQGDENPESLTGCHPNINCSEGDAHQAKKKGVARWLVNGACYCSGSLIMRNNNDFAPYFLTADHCLPSGVDAISNPNLNAVFYWNYEYPGCASSGTVPIQTTSGAVVKANDGSSSSDFAIVELNSNPAASYDVYFNGWTQNAPGTSGVGIHHPGCTPKSISTYVVAPTNCVNRYWNVDWTATANGHGVTEGGSSGSPLFNDRGHILGQLFGAICGTNGNCPSPSTDFSDYGRISYSWGNNGATDNRRKLQPWISPTNTTLMEHEGGYTCTNTINLSGVLRNAGYNAITTINADGTIAATERVFMNAGTSITLTDGFEAKDGSVVEGKIQGCTIPAPFVANVDQYKEPTNERKERKDSPSLEDLTMTAFPNPFASNAKVNFYLPSDMKVTVQVFDMMGRLVASPVLSIEMAKGSHIVDIDGSSWSSGTYRCVLRAGTMMKNVKLVLVK